MVSLRLITATTAAYLVAALGNTHIRDRAATTETVTIFKELASAIADCSQGQLTHSFTQATSPTRHITSQYHGSMLAFHNVIMFRGVPSQITAGHYDAVSMMEIAGTAIPAAPLVSVSYLLDWAARPVRTAREDICATAVDLVSWSPLESAVVTLLALQTKFAARETSALLRKERSV
ncbi:unnamed protein product [Clonostachys byssicola]|uniref:Uncharacterized protein n=1 Tax=Clonostachys byssicola TaxID=160290 RepID=A0A9N9Y1V8_9HYPO|nr:unnamed protein product [Clonostachys byssicola]